MSLSETSTVIKREVSFKLQRVRNIKSIETAIEETTMLGQIFVFVIFFISLLSSSYSQKLKAANDNLTASQEIAVLQHDLTDFIIRHTAYYEKNISPAEVWALVENLTELTTALRSVENRLSFVFGDSRTASIRILSKDIPKVSRRLVEHLNRLIGLAIERGHFDILINSLIDNDYQASPKGTARWPTNLELASEEASRLFLKREGFRFFEHYRKYLLPSYMRTQLVQTQNWPTDLKNQFEAERKLLTEHYELFFDILNHSPEFQKQFEQYAESHYRFDGLTEPLGRNQQFQGLNQPSCMSLLASP